jgi:hypothetical protein
MSKGYAISGTAASFESNNTSLCLEFHPFDVARLATGPLEAMMIDRVLD